MPVMLGEDEMEEWLGGEVPVVDAGIDTAVRVTAVSPKMNSI